MGKATRLACAFAPFFLSIISLLLLLIVFLGGLSNSSLSLYHYRIDTTQFKAKQADGTYMVPGAKITDNLLYALTQSSKQNILDDYYEVYQWDYCSINKTSSNGAKDVVFCSQHKDEYYFNPLEVWGMNSMMPPSHIPEIVQDPMLSFKKGAQWLFTSYILSLCSTVATIIIGAISVVSTRVSPFVTATALVRGSEDHMFRF